MSIVKHYFNNEEDLLQKIYSDFKKEIQKINNCNQVVALAGGSTPQQLYTLLSQDHWDHVFFTLTDERILPKDHMGRNETLLYQTLYKNTKSPQFFSLVPFQATSMELEKSLNTSWQDLNKKLYLILLGMGEDGHIASLFPPQVYNEKNKKIFVDTKGPMPFSDRIGLSFNGIFEASKIFLLIKGLKKKEILEKALLKEDAHLPISILLAHAKKPIHIYWCA